MDDKKSLEQKFGMEFLKQLNPDFISLIWNKDDPDPIPDIILRTQPVTGIEITRISNTLKAGHPRMHLEGSWDILLNNMRKIWLEKGFPPVHINLLFNQDTTIPKISSKNYAKIIIDFIKDFIPPDGQSFHSKDELITIPSILYNFIIERKVKYDKPMFTYSDYIWSPYIEVSAIQHVINKKEQKREDYLKNCEIIWLLMFLYSGKASGNFIIPQEVLEHQYFSHFNKVFLFDAVPKKFWELIID